MKRSAAVNSLGWLFLLPQSLSAKCPHHRRCLFNSIKKRRSSSLASVPFKAESNSTQYPQSESEELEKSENQLMGFLHKLWDETVAGPPPDSGVISLRELESSTPATRSPIAVTRSITIITTQNSSLCRSIAEMMPNIDFDESGRSKVPPQSRERAEPRNPTVYDWIVISALDR